MYVCMCVICMCTVSVYTNVLYIAIFIYTVSMYVYTVCIHVYTIYLSCVCMHVCKNITLPPIYSVRSTVCEGTSGTRMRCCRPTARATTWWTMRSPRWKRRPWRTCSALQTLPTEMSLARCLW